jgi:hypothetical protein
MKKAESISFLTDDNTEVEFFILEQTTINGRNYLLVSEEFEPAEDEDTIVYIMREADKSEDDMVSYEIVEEEKELESVSIVFEQLMEDMDIEVE